MSLSPTQVASEIIGLADSPLFHQEWYAATYAGTIAGEGAAIIHFCNGGWEQGLRPNPFFDTAFYIASNIDVREARVNPLLHYIQYGEAENRRPSEDFDVAWYRRTYQIPADLSCLADYLRRRALAGAVSTNAGFDADWYRAENALSEAADAFAHYQSEGAPAGLDPSPEARVIRQSKLFDAEFYRRAHPIDPMASPLYHFCNIGWQQGYRPNPLFDTAWYLASNPEVREAAINPLFHYISWGEFEGRWPSPAFDPQRYRQTNDVPPFVSSLGHRLLSPVDDFWTRPANPEPTPEDAQLVARSELFDLNYYLANYPDVRESSLDPAAHFMTYGWMEGRRPNPYFDSAWYCKTYLAGQPPQNPLLHYILFGEVRGNRPIVYFDPRWYVRAHLLPPGEPALKHYLQHRRGQCVSPTPLFDIAWYMERHAAEIGANRDPFAHYLRVGIAGDVSPGPEFDAVAYRRAQMDANIPPPRPVAGAEIVEKLRREVYNPLVHFLLREAEVDAGARFSEAG